MEAIINKLSLSNAEGRAYFLKISGIIFLAIALAYILVVFSVKWSVAIVFALFFCLFLLLDLKNSLFLLIILRVNLDALHHVLNFPISEYKSLSLPSLLGVLIFFVGLFYLFTRKIEFWKIPVARPFTFFFAACFTSLLFSEGSLNTLSEIMEIGSFMLLYVMTIGILQEEKDIKKMVNLLIFSSFIPLAVGFIELFSQFGIAQLMRFESSSRLYSTTPHCNVYAFYLVMISILVTSVVMQEKSYLKRKGLFLLLGLLIFSIILTYMRGAWIGLILAMLVLGALKKRKLLLLAPLGAILAIHVFPSISQRLTPILDPNSFQYTSLGWRINLWMLSITYFLQHPLFGIGFGNYIFAQYEMMELYIGAHNDYLRILVETGIVGFSCFIWILLSLLKLGIKAYKKWNNAYYKHLCLGFLGVWVAYVVMSITENYFNHGTLQWYFWTYAAVIAKIYMKNPTDVSNSKEVIQ